MTAGPEEFLSVAGEFLRAEPARNSVMLTVTADLLATGPANGPAGMLYGWWRPDDGPLAAASQAALDAGTGEVVLYTDLANPTSNALYERLGYRPVEDRVVLTFTPAATLHP